MTPEQRDLYQNYFATKFNSFVGRAYSGDEELMQAIRYVLMGPGKRIRAMLALLAAEAVGGNKEAAVSAAIAVEMIHTYSLIHDDLPCLDNDVLRRGQPTVHVKFSEATALLAGDALATDAFAILSEPLVEIHEPSAKLNAERRLQQVWELAHAAGRQGMVAGQALDVYWTAKQGATKADLDRVHLLKTGYLLGGACALGAIAGGSGMQGVHALRSFGHNLGLAFQIIDDLLDDNAHTGKTRGKDQAAGKLTYLRQMGRGEAEEYAKQYTTKAISMLKSIDGPTDSLIGFAQLLLDRTL